MTVSALPATVTYMEDGSSVSFAVPFRFKAPGELVVERLLSVGGKQQLTLGVDYSVTGGATDAGGTLVRRIATNGARLRISRDTMMAQGMIYAVGDRFPAKSHEEALDTNMMATQDQAVRLEELDRRAVTLPDGETQPELAPLAQRIGGRRKLLAVNPTTGSLQIEEIGDTFAGNTGPADNTYTSLTALLASDPTRKSARLVPGVGETASAGNFNYIDGAWRRQGADGITTADGATAEAGIARIPYASATPENLAMTPRPTLKFNFAVERALAAGVLNITTVGNSIPEGAGLSYANNWVEQLITMLRMELPGIQVNHTNLCIGGRNMAQLADSTYVATASTVSPGNFYIAAPTGINSTFWPGGSVTGKSWRDHVRDSAPDIIILEHGENDGIDSIALRNSFVSFEGYSQTWAKRPWFVLVSSLVPEGIEPNRQDKQAFADFWQFTAIERHYGNVNANNWYRMMRDGARRNFVPAIEEDSFTGFGDTTRWQTQNGVALAGTTLATQANGRAERQITARDFDLVDYFTLASDDVRWQCEARRRPGTNDVYLIQTAFSDQGDGNGGAVRLYFRDEVVAIARIPVRTAGQSVRIRAKFAGPIVLVWHDNVLVFTGRANVGLYAGAVAIGTVVGGGAHAQFKLAYAPEYVEAQKGYFSSAYLLNDNLHHPTADGAFRTYVRAAREFVADFIATARRAIKLTAGPQTSAKSFPTGANQVQADTAITVNVSGAQYATCFIQMGYLNFNTSVGAVTLRVNGVGVTTFYLDPDPVGTTRNRQLSVTAQAPLVAGTNVIDLLYAPPQGGSTAITSNGADNTRMLVAEVAVL